jgi:hypothetical protein
MFSKAGYPGSGTWLLSDRQIGIQSRSRTQRVSGSDLPGDISNGDTTPIATGDQRKALLVSDRRAAIGASL